MKNQKIHYRFRSLVFILSFFLLIATIKVFAASEPPADYAAIQKSIPDSITLKDKVVYVDFWASWCIPCHESFPWMQSIYDKYHSKGLEIVAVNVDKDHNLAVKFLEENKVTFPVIFDPSGDLANIYGLQAMPSSYIYGRDGKFVSMHLGFRPDDIENLEDKITELLIRGPLK